MQHPKIITSQWYSTVKIKYLNRSIKNDLKQLILKHETLYIPEENSIWNNGLSVVFFMLEKCSGGLKMGILNHLGEKPVLKFLCYDKCQ